MTKLITNKNGTHMKFDGPSVEQFNEDERQNKKK